MKGKFMLACFKSRKASFDCRTETGNQKVIQENGSPRWQFVAATNVGLIGMGFGAADLWTSPALPYLESQKSEFPITPDQGSLIVSIFHIGAIIGCLLNPLFVDRIGRKYSLLLFSLFQTISWALIIFTQNTNILYAARLFNGIGSCGGFMVQIIYVVEISEKEIRGTLMFLSNLSFYLGSLVTATIGAFVSYDTMNFILLSIPLLFTITFPFMPETPYYHLKCNREEEALQSISKLRGISDSKIFKEEINRIKESIVEGEKNKGYSLKNLFLKKRCRKALVIVLLLKLGLVFSGGNVISAYGQEIFDYSGFSLAPKYTVIIVTFIQFVVIAPTAPLVDYVGRRFLTVYSSMICSLSLFVVGMFFFLKYYVEVEDLSSISWLPLAALLVYHVACAAGLSNTTTLLSGELFPIESKNLVLALLNILREILIFLATAGYKKSIEVFCSYGLFWIYAVSCFVFPLISFLIMPETKGKSLEEIQVLLD